MSLIPLRWLMLATICLYVLGLTLALQGIPPVLSLIIEDLHISHAEAGLIMSTVMLPGILLLIPTSLLASRINIKYLGLASIFLTICGLVIVYLSKSFHLILLGRIVLGIGSIALPFIGTQGVAQWFLGNRLGLAMGIYNSIFVLSSIIPLNTFGAVSLLWGWRSTVLITIVVNIFIFIIFVIFFRRPPVEAKIAAEQAKPSGSWIFKIGVPLWLLALSWCLFQASTFSITTFLPDFIYQSGYDLKLAGTLTSVMMIFTLFMGPVYGYLIDKIRYKEILMMINSAICAVLIVFLPLYTQHILIFMILLGIATTPFPTATFSIVPGVVKRQMMSLAYGIIATMSFIGAFAAPFIAGKIRDATGSYTYSFWLIILFMVLYIVIIYTLFRTRRKQNES